MFMFKVSTPQPIADNVVATTTPLVPKKVGEDGSSSEGDATIVVRIIYVQVGAICMIFCSQLPVRKDVDKPSRHASHLTLEDAKGVKRQRPNKNKEPWRRDTRLRIETPPDSFSYRTTIHLWQTPRNIPPPYQNVSLELCAEEKAAGGIGIKCVYRNALAGWVGKKDLAYTKEFLGQPIVITRAYCLPASDPNNLYYRIVNIDYVDLGNKGKPYTP